MKGLSFGDSPGRDKHRRPSRREMIEDYAESEQTEELTEKSFRPHPYWIRIEKGEEKTRLWSWGDSKCDYCENAADMVCAGFHACFEHRDRLLKEKGHLAEEAYARKLTELESESKRKN